MYYYAFVDENDIVQAIYQLPTAIEHTQYIQIASNDQTLVGKHYNRSTLEFENVYYYAILNDKSIVTEVTYSYEATTESGYIAITAAQYADSSLVGMYWNGTAFVTAPISLIAVASTDTVNYKNQDKWLSTKLDEIDEAITGKASTIHAHTAADISGVVKTVNGVAPDSNGNVAVSGGTGGTSTMTAAEILEAVKTVDGTGSGLDADTLDGMEATAFATAQHTHTGYATTDDITALEWAIEGKANSNHNHDTAYAAIDHTHSGYATTESVTAISTALNGKSDTNHTHSNYLTADDIDDLEASLDGKADASHTHAQSDIAGLSSALNGKADASHSHSDYLSTSGGTVSGNLNVTGILRVNGQQSIYDSGSMVTLSTNNRQTMIAGSAIYSKVQIAVSSDERLKEGIKPVDTSKMVDFIKGIDVKTYNYIGNDTECIGAIAQQIQGVNPDIAKYFVSEGEEGYLSVKVADFVFPLIVAVQQMAKEIEQLKKKK